MVKAASRRILLVEDHHDTARAMARLLNLSGYDVRTATSCNAALELCNEVQFDLVISDVGLPDGTGYDLMRQMLDRSCTTKGIAVSGYGSEQDVEDSRRAGILASSRQTSRIRRPPRGHPAYDRRITQTV